MVQPVYQRPDEEQMLREVEDKLKTDASFLKIVHSMMWAYAEERPFEENLMGYEPDGTPIKTEDFLKDADRIVDEMESGKTIPASEVYQKIDQWLKSTK